jgi:hypothetical protein
LILDPFDFRKQLRWLECRIVLYHYRQNFFKCFDFLSFKAENCRQNGDFEFASLLENIRYRKVTLSDFEKLKSRQMRNLSTAEIAEFENSVAIFPKNVQVNSWNLRQLEKIGNPIVRISPQTKLKYQMLPSELDLYLCKSAPVIHTICASLCIQYNLVNGSRGVVH